MVEGYEYHIYIDTVESVVLFSSANGSFNSWGLCIHGVI